MSGNAVRLPVRSGRRTLFCPMKIQPYLTTVQACFGMRNWWPLRHHRAPNKSGDIGAEQIRLFLRSYRVARCLDRLLGAGHSLHSRNVHADWLADHTHP
jgi:hypothetical protein